MRTYKPMAGDSISITAKAMVALALATDDHVTCSFNDIALEADPASDANSIVQSYWTEIGRLQCEREQSADYAKRMLANAQRDVEKWTRRLAELGKNRCAIARENA